MTIEQAKQLTVGNVVVNQIDGQELLGEVIVKGVNKLFIRWEDDFTGEIDFQEARFAQWVLDGMELV